MTEEFHAPEEAVILRVNAAQGRLNLQLATSPCVCVQRKLISVSTFWPPFGTLRHHATVCPLNICQSIRRNVPDDLNVDFISFNQNVSVCTVASFFFKVLSLSLFVVSGGRIVE